MIDDELFREALEAHGGDPVIPAGFAERVTARVAARPSRRAWATVAGAAAACAIAALGWQTRERSGEVRVAATAAGPRQVWLGDRARVVLEPGTTLRYRVGGWSPSRRDVVELAAGSGFFRVDRGGSFEVRAPHGTVRVTGTCFRVSAAADGGEATMTRAARARWFGAGAATVALAVMVYEGGVTLAGTSPGRATRLGPGDAAAVRRDGTLMRLDGPAAAAGAEAAAAVHGAADPARGDGVSGPRAELEREVARLRAILAANHLSPETGDAAAPRRRGIDSDGETDLTPDEWRQLAQRGELRFALPGTGGRDPDARINHQAHEMGLRDHEVLGVREVFRRELERLQGDLRGLYREAAGSDPGNLSLDALQSEIRDKTPGDTVALVDWRLAQERGGLAEAPAARADASPYERMMRAVVGYEARVAEALTALVGATASHDLLHGPGAVGGHSYGRTARVGDAGAR